MAEGKTIGAWLSGKDLEKAEARAKKIAKGNNSLYVKQLILADLAGSGPDLSEGTDVITKLAHHYHPTIAEALAVQLSIGEGEKPVNQARAIMRFLEALNQALEGQFNPEQPYHLGLPGSGDAKLFEALCKDAAPELTPVIEETLFKHFKLGTEPAYQRRFLGLLMTALAEALESPGFDPLKPFHIADARTATAPTDAHLKAFLQKAIREAMAEPLHLVAEDEKPAKARKVGTPKNYPQGSFPTKVKIQPPDGRTLIRAATSKHPASSSKSKAS